MDDMKKFAKIKLSTIVCGAFIILSLLYFLEGMSMRYWSSQYAPGPGFIPRWIGGIMIVLSVIAFVQSFRREGITLGEILPKEVGHCVPLSGGNAEPLRFLYSLQWEYWLDIRIPPFFSVLH